jgi:ganglioside-induced differentiation-associated protein 1
MLTLYHHGSSVCAAKVRLVLEEKGIEWTGNYVDVLKGEQFEPAYLKLNPNAVVPTLIHDGQVIIESTLICEYLDDIYTDTTLRPADAYSLVKMRLWTKRVDERLHPMTSVLTYVSSHRHSIIDNNTPDEIEAIINQTTDPVKRERKRDWIELGLDAPSARMAVAEFKTTLHLMNETLAEGSWLAGDAYSLADIALTPYANRLSMLNMNEFLQRYPNVMEWFERIQARDSFQPAMLSWIPETLATSLATNGERSWPAVRDMLDAA